jgi:hypothetical protein
MKTLLLSLCLVCFALPAVAKDHLVFHPVKVLSQSIGTSNDGVAVMPIGSMLAGVPIRRQSNIVVIETTKARLTLSEKGRHFLILPVNGTVECSHKGSWVIMLDSKKKEHKFAVIHVEMLQSPAQK